MTEKEFMEEDYRKRMEEHHRKMEIRREKRRQQRNFHIFLGILILSLPSNLNNFHNLINEIKIRTTKTARINL